VQLTSLEEHVTCLQPLKDNLVPHAVPFYSSLVFREEFIPLIVCLTTGPSLFQGITYLLTPWCRVLLEKLTGLQLVKKFPAFHGTRMFITALTNVRHLSLPWANPIQSMYPHPTSWRSILILSTHLRLVLPSGLLPSGFPSKNLYTPPLFQGISLLIILEASVIKLSREREKSN